MPNMAQAVSRHNAKVLKDDLPPPPPPGCNCRNGPGTCPVQAQCLTDCVVYRATVKETVSGKEETYTGMTGNTFKDRWNGHKSDTRNPDNKSRLRCIQSHSQGNCARKGGDIHRDDREHI